MTPERVLAPLFQLTPDTINTALTGGAPHAHEHIVEPVAVARHQVSGGRGEGHHTSIGRDLRRLITVPVRLPAAATNAHPLGSSRLEIAHEHILHTVGV